MRALLSVTPARMVIYRGHIVVRHTYDELIDHDNDEIILLSLMTIITFYLNKMAALITCLG
jgi:hypothetical protein